MQGSIRLRAPRRRFAAPLLSLAVLALSVAAAACTSLAHSKGGGDQAESDAAIARGDASAQHEPAPHVDAGRLDAGHADAGHPSPDGSVSPDAGQPCEQLTFYADMDGDDYGDPATALSACEAPAGYVSDRSDCDDTCKACHPGADETCNQRDDNCDDTVDEGCACEPGTSRPCGEERGVCEPGTQACTDGVWSSDCDGARGPDPMELCNGLDDDCNGSADDAFPELGTDCTNGKGECARAGHYVCDADPHASAVCDATPGNAVTELCGNGLDDDCDGDADEAPSSTTCCIDAHCGTNQKCGSGGSCVDKTGCELRSKPSDVLAADYQCLDFDRTASFSPWTAVTSAGGGIAISTDQATSAPNSVYATLGGNTNSEGRLRWNATGAKAIKSVSLAAEVHFHEIIGFHELWVGHDEVLCIRYSSSSYCVYYAHNDESIGGWSLALEEVQTTNAIETHVCQLAMPAENVWSRIELRVSTTGAPIVYLNGSALSSPDCIFSLLNTTSVALEAGLKQTDADEAWQLYFDDIEAMIRR
jgi:hypothetical protein